MCTPKATTLIRSKDEVSVTCSSCRKSWDSPECLAAIEGSNTVPGTDIRVDERQRRENMRDVKSQEYARRNVAGVGCACVAGPTTRDPGCVMHAF